MYRYIGSLPGLRRAAPRLVVNTRRLSSSHSNLHMHPHERDRHGNPLTTAPEGASSQHVDEQQSMARNSSSVSVTNVAMRNLYRRLIKAGESTRMMRHCISVHTPQATVRYGLLLLRLHRELTNVGAQSHLSLLHPVRRVRCAVRRRYYAARLLAVRLRLRSLNAFSDVLVYLWLVATAALLYQIYKTCRIGIYRAEDRYRALAIPIVQTFDALEAAQQRRKALRAEMDADILRDRSA